VSLSGSDLAEQTLPSEGWAYEYVALEPPRRGRDVFRPVVPVRLAPTQASALAALVDSGSEHTLAARWLADDLGIDLARSTDRLLLGVGGRTVEAVFVDVDLRLDRDDSGDDFVSWHTEVGFLEPWDAEFFVILGQTGFYDQFTITMNRRVLTIVVHDVETPLTQ
jgi:Aspartyl protease